MKHGRLFLALATAVSSSCGTAPAFCGPATCASGCCSVAGLCEVAESNASCGTAGAMCQSCGLGESCVLGTCHDATAAGGGSVGGGSTGGGTAASGGGNTLPGGADASGGGEASDGGTSASDLCPTIMGSTRVGADWVYAYNDDSSMVTGTITNDITASQLSGTSQVITVQSVSELSDESNESYRTETTSTMTCDSTGVHVSSVSTGYSFALLSGAVTGSTEAEYTPPYQLYPPNVTSTSSWSTSSTLTETSSMNASPMTSQFDESFAFVGTQMVDVLGAHYTAYVLQTTYMSNTTTTYVVPGIGMVEDGAGIEQLTEYHP